MRPIKFRAWDKLNKMFVRIDGVSFATDGSIIKVDTELLDFSEFYEEDNSEYLHDVILMQCTGLKDKNGVEIYEGDIVREKNADDEGIVVEVVWRKGAFYGRENGFEPEYLVADFLEGEVIGNIYETRNYWRS